jgi:hypothetical protein
VAVKAIVKRLCRLEDQFGTADGKPRLSLVVRPAGSTMALDTDRCIEILGECGFVQSGPGILLLNFMHVPHGLNARELESYSAAMFAAVYKAAEWQQELEQSAPPKR